MSVPITSPTLAFVPVPELILDYSLSFAVTVFVFAWWYRSYSRIGIRIGDMAGYLRANWKRMVVRYLTFGIFHRKNVKNRYAGVMHILISFGILILFIATALIFLSHDILKPLFHFGILIGYFYLNYEVWANLGGVMLVAGLVMALYRRLVKKVRLETLTEDYIVIAGLLILALEGFFLGALKISLMRNSFDSYRFIEWGLSYLFPKIGLTGTTGIVFYRDLWLAHVASAFALVAYLPYSKLSHMALAAVYISAHKEKPRGEMSTPFVLAEALETGNFEFTVGAKKVIDLPKLKLVEAMACTNCGRCERSCPAVMAGTDLDPRVVVQNVKNTMGNVELELNPGILTENASWACTTCQACVEECPVVIDPHSFVMEARRNLVMENRITKETGQYLNNLTNTMNPFGNPPSDRDKLLEHAPKYDSSKDVLYWVGCMGAFDPRDNKTAITILDLLKKANVNFGILGSEEKCTGETARRIGEEGRFQELVMQNVETFQNHGVKKIVTACPHCYNTFKNEYPKFGLKAEVQHHSEFLSDLVSEGRLKMKKGKGNITLHDPCYLGRVNDEYDNTRAIVDSSGNLKEMEKSREKSVCCGAGGGNYWYKVESQDSVSKIRMQQVLDTGADKLAVACPFCMPMLSDAARTLNAESRIEIKDIAELIHDNLAD